ncbi:MAG: TrmB family transcriptional regulator [Nanoarchaeota archaeon]|nr:TrmB family transcriptional regulator [Nanoarchaeota archaeon]
MDALVELGITRNGAKAYEVLVRFGKMSASEISAKSGVPYGRIYDVLESLVEKGFVQVVPEKTKKFVASDPVNLNELIADKRKSLEAVEEKVSELQQFYDDKEKHPVRMVEGRKGFHKIVAELKSAEKFDYSIKWTSLFDPKWVEGVRKKLRKNVDVRSLTRYDEETKKDVDKWFKINKNIRKFSNEGVAMSIIDDKEVMIGLIKSNTTLVIRDGPFAKVMRQLFLASYDGAEKIG